MSARTLLRGGKILSMDDSLGDPEGDVLIVDGRIAEVAPHIDANVDDVIDARGKIVLPGFVDAHVHLWQAPVRGIASSCWGREYFGVVHPLSGRLRPEDMYAATLGASVELLSRGVTTAFDFCHAVNTVEHAEAALRALSESGIRALYGYTFRNRPEAGQRRATPLEERVDVLHRLRDKFTGHERVRLAVSLNNIEHVTPEEHAREVKAARELGLRMSVHANLEEQVLVSADQGLLGPDMLWVHCGPVSDGELRLLSEHGGVIVSTPEAETAQMGVTPVVGRALRRSVPVTIGTDVPAALNGDILAQLRIAHAVGRLTDAQNLREAGKPVRRTERIPILDARRLLRMATIDAARALGLGDDTGSVTPGKLADLQIISAGPFGMGAADPADHVLFQSSSRDLDAVFVGGRQVVDRSSVRGFDMPRLRQGLEAAKDWMLGRTPGADWPDVDDEARAQYEAGQGRR